MGLSNGAKKARNYSSIITQNQGGGEKKAGFPYQIGRESWASVFLGTCNPKTFVLGGRSCCSLKDYNTLSYANEKVGQSRPTWVRPGAGFGFGNNYMLH